MHRNPLLDAIAAYGSRYPAEAETVQRITTFVADHTDCFQRSLETGHITGSAWIVNAENSHALFTHHRKLNMWLQLGGHADGESIVQNVALREAQEESGLTCLELVQAAIFDIDIHPIPERKSADKIEKAHFHYDVRYLIRATDAQPLTVSDESHDLGWFSAAEIRAQFMDRSILRMVEKWQAKSAPN